MARIVAGAATADAMIGPSFVAAPVRSAARAAAIASAAVVVPRPRRGRRRWCGCRGRCRHRDRAAAWAPADRAAAVERDRIVLQPVRPEAIEEIFAEHEPHSFICGAPERACPGGGRGRDLV